MSFMDFATYIKFDGEIRNFLPDSFNIKTLFSHFDEEEKFIARSDTFAVQSYKIVTINNIDYLLLKNNHRAFSVFDKYALYVDNNLYYKPFNIALKQLEQKFVNVDHWSKSTISKMKQTYKENLEAIQFNLDNSTYYPKIIGNDKTVFFSQEKDKLIFNFIYSSIVSTTFSPHQDKLIIVNHNSKLKYMQSNENDKPIYEKEYGMLPLVDTIENRIKYCLYSLDSYSLQSNQSCLFWDETSNKVYGFNKNNYGTIRAHEVNLYTSNHTYLYTIKPEDFFTLVKLNNML
jgi:hypothetical protein